jgi:hypothetical protein
MSIEKPDGRLGWLLRLFFLRLIFYIRTRSDIRQKLLRRHKTYAANYSNLLPAMVIDGSPTAFSRTAWGYISASAGFLAQWLTLAVGALGVYSY